MRHSLVLDKQKLSSELAQTVRWPQWSMWPFSDSNDLSPRRVLDHGMRHVMAPDERRRRLALGADLHTSERYDSVQPCSDLNISVASLKSTRRRTGSQCNSCRTGERCSRRPVCVINPAAAFCTDCNCCVSCRWRHTKLSCSSQGDWRWMPELMSLQHHVTKTAVWV